MPGHAYKESSAIRVFHLWYYIIILNTILNGQMVLEIFKFEKSDWPRAFRSVTGEPDFSQTCSSQRMIENHNSFDFSKLQTNISWLNFLLRCKNHIFGPFLPKIGKTRIFLKNRALSLFNPY